MHGIIMYYFVQTKNCKSQACLLFVCLFVCMSARLSVCRYIYFA